MRKKELVLSVSEQLGLDAVIISNRDNIRYLSGYCGDTGLLLITRNGSTILTDFRYFYQAKTEAEDADVVDIKTAGYSAMLRKLIDSVRESNRIGYEAKSVLVSDFKAWEKACDATEFIAIDEELEALRAIKTPEELENIRAAEAIGDIVFREIIEFIKPGRTEIEIASEIEYRLKAHGAEGVSFAPIVASGVNSSMPHAVPSLKSLKSGDFVTMDFGCSYHGYCSDMTRTVVLGKASEQQRHIYNTVLHAQLAVIEQIRAGMTGKEVDAIAREIIEDSGYHDCFGHGLGHGVGLNVHEAPTASVKSNKLLQPGMTLTVEPGIYIHQFGGVRIEDLGAITEDGFTNFTFSTKQLLEI